MSDAQIEAAIRAKFAKSKIDEEKFQVHVQGGVATIEGRTDVIQHKGVATRMARTAGAAAVSNHIQVSDAAKQKSAANLEEGRRRAQVKRGDARSDPRGPKPSR
jgi:DnaJ-class molecular chaperone